MSDRFCENDLDELKRFIINLYLTDDEIFFKIFHYHICSNNGSHDYEIFTRYNYGFLDWKRENPYLDDMEFYNKPHTYLDDVSVYVFRTNSKLCFYHCDREKSESFDVISINQNDIKSQIEDQINKIDIDENEI